MKYLKFLCLMILAFNLSCTTDRTDFDNNPRGRDRTTMMPVLTFTNGEHQIVMQTPGGKFFSGYNSLMVEVFDANSKQKIHVHSFKFLPIQTNTNNGLSSSCPHLYELEFKSDKKAFEGFAVFNNPNDAIEYEIDANGNVRAKLKNTIKNWSLYLSYTVNGVDYQVKKDVDVSSLPLEYLNRNFTEFMGNDGEKYTLALVEPQTPGVKENPLTAGLYKYIKPANGAFEHKIINDKPDPSLFSYTTVDGATLELDPRMPDPSMGNHSSPNNKHLTQQADKMYHGVVNYTMTGLWTLNFIFKDKNGTVIKGTKVPHHHTPNVWGKKSELFIDIIF